MSFKISTNVPTMTAQRALGKVVTKQETTLARLSSGERITKAADDAAGLAISDNLKAQVVSLSQAARNTGDGISMVQVAEGNLTEVSNMLIRMRELAMQSASDTVGNSEREMTDNEYQELKQEIERVAQSAQFNSKHMLNGEGEKFDFQVGIHANPDNNRLSYDAKETDSTISNLNINSLEINSKNGAQSSLSTLDDALHSVAGQRAKLGALQNRMGHTLQQIQISKENLSTARSRIRDADYAVQTAENAKEQLLMNSATSVTAQANIAPNKALKLIG